MGSCWESDMDHDDHNLGTALVSIIGVGTMLFFLGGALANNTSARSQGGAAAVQAAAAGLVEPALPQPVEEGASFGFLDVSFQQALLQATAGTTPGVSLAALLPNAEVPPITTADLIAGTAGLSLTGSGVTMARGKD
jgi:hypothetical protein